MSDALIRQAADYYTDKLRVHGPTHRGVDWNSIESQRRRFMQLLRIGEGDARLDVNDYGCGYGALVDELVADGRPFSYFGYDVAAAMIDAARSLHPDRPPTVEFSADRAALAPRSYTVASGIFNVKMDTPDAEWWAYMCRGLEDIAAVSSKGFAFNCLTSYSDSDRMRPNLFYPAPEAVFSHCARTFSRSVALLHDYGLFEFTVLVRL